MTQKYIVELEYPEAFETLKDFCSEFDPSLSVDDHVVVVTNLTIDELESIDGVVVAEPETFDHPNTDEPAYTQEEFRSWFLPFLADDDILESARSGKGVDIYVMDTGMRLTHQEFGDRAQTLWSFDDKDYDPDFDHTPSHGTQVASCAAGATVGPAKDARLFNIRYSFTSIHGTKAFDAVLKHHRNKDSSRVSILNMSFGSTSRIYKSIISRLVDEGIICVAAAGNAGKLGPEYPADFDDVIAVGSHDEWGHPSTFTNFGPDLDLYAPGDMGVMADIGSDDDYVKRSSGTSFSAPTVAGMLALICEGSKIRSREGVRQAKKRLLSQAHRGRLALHGDYEDDPNRVPSFNFRDLPINK